jgi:hypothetical protein
VRVLDRLVRRGLGRGLVAELRRTGAPLVTTFYAPAIVADRAGHEPVWCVVTDSDVNRIWAPLEPAASRIRYLVPGARAARRLRAYGAPDDRIAVTGFPLPVELRGGRDLPALRRNLAARLARLDPSGELRALRRDELARRLGAAPPAGAVEPPLLAYAVGGAGAQAELVRDFLPALAPLVMERRLRLALVAGVRAPVARLFRDALAAAGLSGALASGVEIVHDADFDAYYDAFVRLLGRADVLWTKPSELAFYAALGLPLVCAPPVGAHERQNRRWVRESGAGVKQRDARFAAEWLGELLADGALAGAAWSGFERLPADGLYRILDAVAGAGRAPARPARE